MSVVGKNIKIARESQGISQDELAQKMGKSGRATISNWENGKNDPTINDLIKLAEILKTTVTYLVGETIKPQEPASDMMYISKDEYIDLQRKALKREEEKNKELSLKIKELKND